MKWYVETNNGYGPFGVIKIFDNPQDAKRYARNYSRFNGVKCRVTTL